MRNYKTKADELNLKFGRGGGEGGIIWLKNTSCSDSKE